MNTSLRRRRAVAVLALSGLATVASAGHDISYASDSTEPSDTTNAPGSTEATAGTGGVPDAEPLRIGFLPPGLEIPAFQGLWHGIEGYGAGRYGDEVVAIDAKFDPTAQVQAIEQWVQLEQVDAIWTIPVVAEAIAPAVQAAADAGIVIIAGGVPEDYGFDGPQPGMTFADIDNEGFGGGIGELMVDCVDERLGGEADVIYVGSGEGSISVEEINESSQAALAEGAPGATIVQELVAVPNDVAGTQAVIESALQANPDADALMAGDAESTMAGLNVFSAAGKDPQEICIVGNGGTEDQIAAVEAGDLYGVIAFDFEADVVQNVDEMHRMALDPTQAGQLLTIPISVIGG